MSKNVKVSFQINWFYTLIGICVAMVGYHIHGSIFWSIIDFLFWPIVLIYWFITQQINISLIKESFSFFFK